MKGNKKKLDVVVSAQFRVTITKKKTHFLIYSHKNPNKHDRHSSKNGASKWKQHCAAFVMLVEGSVRKILSSQSLKTKITFC